MDEESLKQLWISPGNQQHVEINSGLLVESIARKVISMEKQVRRRDRREIFIAIGMVLFFGWWLITIPQLFAKIGAAIIIATCLLVILKINHARRIKIKENAASEIINNLTFSMQHLRQQIKLLDSVLWWYLLPFFIGVICFYFSLVKSNLSKGIYAVMVVAAYSYIYYLNKRAVKKYLKPLEKNLMNLLNDLSSPEIH